MTMTNPGDIFGSGGGGWDGPKIDDLEGKLCLFTPSRLDVVAKPASFGGKPGETQDRITTDVVIFNDDGSVADKVDDMYLSQKGIVGPLKRCLKEGAKRFVLGRVGKVPSSIGKGQGFDTREKIEEGLKAHFASNGKKEKPNFAWGIDDFTEDEAKVGMAYLAKNGPLASGAE